MLLHEVGVERPTMQTHVQSDGIGEDEANSWCVHFTALVKIMLYVVIEYVLTWITYQSNIASKIRNIECNVCSVMLLLIIF